MRCYHCKKEINTDGKEVNFCPFCGKNPNGETPPHNARRTMSAKIKQQSLRRLSPAQHIIVVSNPTKSSVFV